MLVRAPAAAPRWMPVAAVALVGLVLAQTGLLAVALHRRLSEGFDRATFRRLLRVDSLRLATAALAAALSVALLVA